MPTDDERDRGPGRRAEDHSRNRLEQLLPTLVVACLIGLGVNAVLSVIVLKQQRSVDHNTRRIAHTTGRLDSATFGACIRLQGIRDDVNGLSGTVYQVLSQAAKSSPDSTARRIYSELANRALYFPATDCPQAVGDPEHYKPPRPVAFAKMAACFTARTPRPPVPCPRPRGG